MTIFPVLMAVGLLATTGDAQASRCDHLLRGVDNFSSDRLLSTYKKVIACDSKVANQAFPQFMRAAGDADTLVALSLTAIEEDIWNPVWEMIGKISSYEARDEVADRIGQACTGNPKIVGFLQGAYYGLRDIEFARWSHALSACQDPGFESWLVGIVEEPPPRVYDEKWSSVMEAVVKRKGREALPVLSTAAVAAAANGGPFDTILMEMENTVAPDMGGTMSDEDRDALESALVNVARELGPEQARSVADRLANAGSEAKAAELLPTIYPDIERGGYYWYGGASIEAGECKGEKQAVVHIASVGEPGRRWFVKNDAEEPLRSFRPRLSKCDSVEEPWTVLLSPEPLDRSALSDWGQQVVKDLEEKGYSVKVRNEKEVRLD